MIGNQPDRLLRKLKSEGLDQVDGLKSALIESEGALREKLKLRSIKAAKAFRKVFEKILK